MSQNQDARAVGSLVTGMAYLVVESQKLDDWEEVARKLLGAAVERTQDSLNLRVDHWASRVCINRGEQEAVTAVGWQVTDKAALDLAEGMLRAAGHQVGDRVSGRQAATERECAEYLQVTDPAGNPMEFMYGPRVRPSRAMSTHGCNFVTDDLGMGHVFYVVENYLATLDFYASLGFAVSDLFADGAVTFLHCNPREHSLAFADAESGLGFPLGFNHFLLEVDDADVVGRSYDRAQAGVAPIAYTLGRHSNDLMFSYYLRSPSGFDIELGYGGLRIDPDTWRVRTLIDEDVWGHHAVTP